MKPKTTILMVLAIGCGLAAAFMTNKLIAERNKPADEVKIIKVLVAKKDIQGMTFVKKIDDFFEVQDRPENETKNAVQDVTDKDVKDGFRVARTLKSGAALSHDDIFAKDLEGLSSRVPPNMRAVAVRVTAESLVGGFVLPNSKVDVVWTFRTTNSESGTLTILQDVLVLAVDTQAQRNPESPQTILGATATLALSPEDAQKIRLASLNGDLALTLRGNKDDKKLQLNGTKPSDLAKQSQDNQEEKTESEGGKEGTAVAAVPPLPKLPAAPMADPVTPPPAVEEPPAKPKKIHVLWIEDGPNVQKHQFVFDEETQNFEGAPPKRKDVEEKPEPKPEGKPTAKK